MNDRLFGFIKNSPTAFHAIKCASNALDRAGFARLDESGEWALAPGGAYYVTRNLSSVIAFKIPEDEPSGFMIAASHSDSPMFKIKENAEIKGGDNIRLSTEMYGSMLLSTWFDRPLSIAGRVVVRTDDGIESRLVDFERPVCVIPSVSIHFNRQANEGVKINPAVDTVPLAGIGEGFAVKREAARLAGCAEDDVLGLDLFVYNPEAGIEYSGAISAPRLDNLECAYASLEAITKSTANGAIPVCCIFDNEEVGSATKQGAISTFLENTLGRIARGLGKGEDDLLRMYSASLNVSCDNAQGVHPNHPEFYDANNAVKMNGGVVIKFNANQRYATDAVSAALFKLICSRAGVPVQYYANRSDVPGGSTLGAISTTKVSVNTVDIGLAQIAMHSCYETAGADDLKYMVASLEKLFSSSIVADGDGKYKLR